MNDDSREMMEARPPSHGWSLSEAAAAWFPDLWRAASFSRHDDNAARRLIESDLPPPRVELPADRFRSIYVAALTGDCSSCDPEDQALVDAWARHEAEVNRRIDEARRAAPRAHERLVECFRARMIRGDNVAIGINMAASGNPCVTIDPKLWAVAEPCFGLGEAIELGRSRRLLEAHTVRGLPGGLELKGVRIYHRASILPEPETQPPRTGAAGQPSSMYLIKREWEQRHARGKIESSRKEQAGVLRNWLISEHPEMPPPTEKTIYNQLPAGVWAPGPKRGSAQSTSDTKNSGHPSGNKVSN